MTTLIGAGGLALSTALLLAAASLISARVARTSSERFWVCLLVVQFQLGAVAVACSLLKVLEARAVLMAQAALLGILVLATRIIETKPRPGPRQALHGRFRIAGKLGSDPAALTLAIGLSLVLLVSAVRQLVSSLTGFDDRMYHASRVAYWIQYGTIFFPETHNQRQTVFPFGAELWFGWPLLFLKHEMVGRLAFWMGLPLGAIGIGTVAHAIGLGRAGGLTAALMYAATPIVLLRATSVKSDLWLPIFLLGSAYFAVRGPLPGESMRRSYLLAGACLALATSIKVTAVALGPGLLLVAILATRGTNRARGIGAFGTGLVMGIALSGLVVLVARNAVDHGHPLGPRAMNHVHQVDLSLHQLYVHAVRTPLALFEVPLVPGAGLRHELERAGQMVARIVGADTMLPLEGRLTWVGRFSFSVAPAAVGYSFGGLLWLPCLVLALILAIRELTCSWPRVTVSRLSRLAICQAPLLIGVVFLTRWMAAADSTRFWMGAYALSVPVTVFVLVRLSRRWRWGRWLLALVLTWTVGAALADESRRLVLAIRQPPGPLDTEEPYREALLHLPPRARILLVAHENTRDYPLFNPTAGYVNQVFSWGHEPFDARRVKALIEERRITHVLIDNDRDVSFHWAGRMETSEMVTWLCSRPDFRELSLHSRPMRLFERTPLESTGETRMAATGSMGPAACASDPPSARVSVSGTRFRPGETVTVGLEVSNTAPEAAADLYLGMILPDGHTTVLFTKEGALSVVADLLTPRSFIPTQLAPPGFSQPMFLTYTFAAGAIQAGVCTVFAALVRPGALADNRIDPGDVLTIDTKTLVYIP